MKKIYSLFILFLTASLSFAQSSDLYFSMYGEGSSNNKFLEIYNGTGAAIDLSQYSISTCNGGCDQPNEFDYPDDITFAAGTMIAAGDVYVIAHPSANAAILAQADITYSYLSNGDDTMALTMAGATASTYTIVDIIGDLQGDPGSGWDVAGIGSATANHTLTRKASICDPNPVGLASFGTDADSSEWVVTDIDTEWGSLGSFNGCSSSPSLNITTPADGTVFNSGTTSVTVTFITQNFNVAAIGNGDGHIHWSVNGTMQPMKYDLNDETITVTDGQSYTVYAELVDDSHTAISPAVNQTIMFSVENPCTLALGTEAATCDAETSGTDTYTATIDFTGGGNSTYTITVNDGTVGGDNPSTSASGTITISGITEGTNLQVEITGDPATSSCDLSTSITSPACLGSVVCANPGDIIITEVMQNPSVVNDADGEWFEIYNTTSSDINMQGWSITDETNVTTEAFVISSLIVPANGYAVLGISANTTTNGGVTVNYEYPSNFSLGNGTDGIIISCSDTTIDAVTWDDGATFPDPNGASMELAISAYDATSNDVGSNWGVAVSIYGSGDMGTPGQTNSFTLATDTFNNVTFTMFPNPTTNSINIKATGSGDINVQVYDLLGKQVKNEIVSNNKLDVANLNTGIYLVKFTQGNATATQKLVIK